MEQGSQTEPGIEKDTPIVRMMCRTLPVFAHVGIQIHVCLYCLNAYAPGLSRSEPRTFSGDSSWEFASVLGSTKLPVLFEWDLVTRRSRSNHRFPSIRESSRQTFEQVPGSWRKLACR